MDVNEAAALVIQVEQNALTELKTAIDRFTDDLGEIATMLPVNLTLERPPFGQNGSKHRAHLKSPIWRYNNAGGLILA